MDIRVNTNKLDRTNKFLLYVSAMRPLLNRRALFTDCTQEYVKPCEPKAGENVKIYFRTAKQNVDKVFLIHESEEVEMNFDHANGEFDFYSIEIQMTEDVYFYDFFIVLKYYLGRFAVIIIREVLIRKCNLIIISESFQISLLLSGQREL